MKFQPTDLEGAWLIALEPHGDTRGFFARTFCVREFADHGLETIYPQHNTSLSRQRGTVRGMHYQRDPHAEVKIVRCLRGRIWDVIVDIQPASPTYRRWQGFELTADNRLQLYIPKGFAHGFQTLTDDAEVGYLMSAVHAPSAAAGFRHDDPSFGIQWPEPVTVLSDKDRSWPDFNGG